MHHAYLYRSSAEFRLEHFAGYFPDKAEVTKRAFATIGIDEVRSIIREVMLMPGGEKAHHVIILEAERITHEAEQAMLKVFEDPRPGVTLVLKLPVGYQLIATLRSRFFELEPASSTETGPEFEEFLALSYRDRLALIADRTTKKDTAWLMVIKNGLRVWLEQSAPETNLALYQLVVTNLNQRGASNKMLLEVLALSLPKR